MQRGLLGIAAAATVCALCYLALKSVAATGLPVADLTLITAAATLVLAAVATGFAVQATIRAHQARAEMTRLARSVDAALREVAANTARDGVAAREAAALITVAPLAGLRGQTLLASATTAGSNVVPLPAARAEDIGSAKPPFPRER